MKGLGSLYWLEVSYLGWSHMDLSIPHISHDCWGSRRAPFTISHGLLCEMYAQEHGPCSEPTFFFELIINILWLFNFRIETILFLQYYITFTTSNPLFPHPKPVTLCSMLSVKGFSFCYLPLLLCYLGS